MSHLLRPWAAWEVANANDAGLPGNYQPWLNGSWQALRKQIDEAYAFGFRVFFIHRPFGESDQGDVMDADARVDLIDLPLVRSYPEFQASLLADYPDLHLVPYIGSLRDSDMTDRIKRGDFAEWIDRARRSYLPLLNAERVHIGLDHAVTYPANSPEWKFCELIAALLKTQGRECIVESLPRSDQQDYIGLCTEAAWSEHPEWTRPARGGVRWWNGKAQWLRLFDADPRKWLADVRNTGFTPLIDWRIVQQHNITPQELGL